MSVVLLHTNDFHGTLDARRAETLVRAGEGGALYFDTGDCIKAGNLAIPTREEEAWLLLEEAGCRASVLGNRETHPLEAALRAKIKGARHPVLCANMRSKDGSMPLPGSLILEANGLRIGVFGVMVPMVTARMKTQFASAYLWDQPLPVAAECVAQLRSKVDFLIALTHIGIASDRALAQASPEIDVILGGHSHTVLQQPERVGRTWICQGGSHGRFYGRYEWSKGNLSGGLVPF